MDHQHSDSRIVKLHERHHREQRFIQERQQQLHQRRQQQQQALQQRERRTQRRRVRRQRQREERRLHQQHQKNHLSNMFDHISGQQHHRRYVLRAVRLQDQQQESPEPEPTRPQRILAPDEDIHGIHWGHMFDIFGDTEIKGQSRSDRWGMVRDLRALGLLDKDAYPTVLDFIESLPHLYRRCDILTVTDARVFQFLVEGWSKEGTFDIYKSMKIFDRTISKINTSTPAQTTPYFRDAGAVIAELP